MSVCSGPLNWIYNCMHQNRVSPDGDSLGSLHVLGLTGMGLCDRGPVCEKRDADVHKGRYVRDRICYCTESMR